MITIEECIAMCGLTQDEVLAIAEHEHISEIAAAALGQYLLTQDDGTEKISAMLRDDILLAIHRNDRAHARPAVHGATSFPIKPSASVHTHLTVASL